MIVIENNQVRSDADKWVRRIGGETCFRRGIALPGDTPEMFDELDSVPVPLDGNEYNEKVNSLIRERYSLSEELAILRQRDSKPDEFDEYFRFAEECKAKARPESGISG